MIILIILASLRACILSAQLLFYGSSIPADGCHDAPDGPNFFKYAFNCNRLVQFKGTLDPKRPARFAALGYDFLNSFAASFFIWYLSVMI